MIFVDRTMQAWNAYTNNPAIRGRPIKTIGDKQQGLEGDFWIQTVDLFTHLLLPTMALILISLASYTRYSRASLLEVLNQDYIRTARSKGLTERTVIMRHAFRNAHDPAGHDRRVRHRPGARRRRHHRDGCSSGTRWARCSSGACRTATRTR